MSTQQCTQPGCTGTIQDGYCDVCGMAAAPGGASTATPAPAAAAAPAAPAASVAASADGTPCTQPGCTGKILDGYCDVCGSPAASVAAAPAVGGESAPMGVGEVSVATSAASVRSAAIGSRLAQSTGSSSTRRTRSGSQRMRAARLGAGLTVVPPAPAVDASLAIQPNPQVPEDKRSCSKCGNKIGRSVDGRPGRTEGFCPQCGQQFSFTPKLHPGDLVAGQYEVVGAIAHGGLGWIYLAKDRNVSNRWVVLKGLLNSGDPDALAAAIAEQQFLAQVEHPLIVEIYNFVTHEGAGYIVMEYVGGKSLKQILKARMTANNGLYDALPVDQALAYLLEVLPAFQYLHDLGLVYCDFKPDNLIQVGDAVKLIDLGGVRRIDDEDSAIYGTVGYQAPEVAEVGPSVASDIYTIGRTLVVLCMEFRGYQGTYLHTLPPPETTPLFQQHDSLYWLIAKCCAPDPADRFASADELRAQLIGVLREVVAARTRGTALTSAASVLFESPATATSVLSWSALPDLRPDTTDAQHAFLATIGATDPAERLANLSQAPEDSAEVFLARGHAALDLQDAGRAHGHAAELLAADPWDWRALWLDGLAYLQQEDWTAAQSAFSAVYQQVPGELAPKLALAVACERGGLPEVAEGLYATCAATDATYVAPAAFGMARVRAGRGDTAGAVAALDMVPKTSRGYPESRQLRAEVLLAGSGSDLAVLDQAMRSIESVSMDPTARQRYTVRILTEALQVVTAGGKDPRAGIKIGEHAASEAGLRAGLETAYRALAREAPLLQDRVSLVNQANAVRSWTLT
ncbi:serine/threonine-protein kinase [Nocardioides lianchengensis]|uniref:non-specific serine/threonine protein kinase n=1 Tax=Nocardioides lianchengensis TaxID=1045774 RepID=A0A1G6NLI2_9ACTN|nr:serine/threonine-protein kinase [Nocardioides lianchengensis]NYG10818.1 serine/threonine-protein kinase PknG [Nocardioides lianchengensis]SDC68822.1 serine/threonine-protein kinase PknG [Nocardioides lianchengensis]